MPPPGCSPPLRGGVRGGGSSSGRRGWPGARSLDMYGFLAHPLLCLSDLLDRIETGVGDGDGDVASMAVAAILPFTLDQGDIGAAITGESGVCVTPVHDHVSGVGQSCDDGRDGYGDVSAGGRVASHRAIWHLELDCGCHGQHSSVDHGLDLDRLQFGHVMPSILCNVAFVANAT